MSDQWVIQALKRHQDWQELIAESREERRQLEELHEILKAQDGEISALGAEMCSGFARVDEKFGVVLTALQAIADRLPEPPADTSGS